LKTTVEQIYESMKIVETEVANRYPSLVQKKLPDAITFVHAEELE